MNYSTHFITQRNDRKDFVSRGKSRFRKPMLQKEVMLHLKFSVGKQVESIEKPHEAIERIFFQAKAIIYTCSS